MNVLLRALLPAAALTLALAPHGGGETPRHIGEALAEQRNLVRERPDDAGVWNDLGNLLAMRGDYEEAESAYGRALEIAPESTTARFNLGLLRQQRGDLGGAVADYRALLEVDSGNAWAHYQLGAAYESQGQRALALERYAEAFTLDPELLFAENNPHIIENELVTEALLHARRGSRSRPPAPRAYDEPGRITAILTPVSPVPAAGPAGTAEPPVDDGPPMNAGPPSIPAVVTPQGATNSRQLPARGVPGNDSARLAPPTDRVLDSSDLRGSVRNQVQGDAAAGAPAAPGTRRRSSASVTPASGRRPTLHQPPQSDDMRAFGFGQRSTGALEWRLGPASDEPVPAR